MINFNRGVVRLMSAFIFTALTLSVSFGAPENGDGPKKSKDAAKSESSFKPFSEVTKDTQKFEGLFNFYLTKEGQVYVEIQPNQLDSYFQITMQISRGIGDLGVLAGTPLDDYAFVFHRVNNEVQFIRKNTAFKATPDSPLSRSVARDFTDSILANLKILSIQDDKQSLLVDAVDLFSSDLPNVAHLLNLSIKGGHYSQDGARSSIRKIEAFPLNDEVEMEADFASPSQPKEAAFLDSLPDWRNIPLGLHYSFSSLPKGNYAPRLADDRIGYFTTDTKDFSSQDPDTAIVQYINRWNMTKKPIVFWIENTAPVEYREAIKEGILEWNKAFAKAGIDNALEAEVQPDSPLWSSSDIRYNVVHWISPSESRFAGVGPSHVNPLTGEIYNASVAIDGEALRRVEYIYRYEINLKDKTNKLFGSRLCALPSLKAQEGARAVLALQLQSSNPGDFKVPEAFMQAYVKELVMHEVGHTLGLRHNFHASTFLSLKEIQDKSITGKTGLSASVMDYLPINVAAPGEKQGDYFSTTIGTYDYWAIEYGYLPSTASSPQAEKETLNKVASRSTLPGYIYSTDEDTFSPYHIDPKSMIFDISSDPLGFSEERFRLYEKLWEEIFKKLPFSGESFSQTRRAFDLVFSGYASFSTLPGNYVGGQFFNRAHAEGAKVKSPLVLIPKPEQLKALDILDRYVFGEKTFSFPAESLNKLAPDRRIDRFSDLEPYVTPFDYPLLQKVSEIREGVLKQFFRPVLLRRLVENEKKTDRAGETLTLPDLFEWMTAHFWSELAKSENISPSRRNLQRSYLEHLVELVVQPKPQMFGMPENEIPPLPIATVPQDAQSGAEHQLSQIQIRLQKALKNSRMNVATRSHLEFSLHFIHKALNAKMEESLGGEGPGPSEQE